MDIPKIQARLKEFALERDWEQYHSPKNLSMALSVEASELMEIFQWVGAEDSARSRQEADRSTPRQRIWFTSRLGAPNR